MVDYAGNAIPAAGVTRGKNVPDDELLYSTAGFSQKGVTLAPGQGVLVLGTVLARRNSDKLYVKFASSGGPAGANMPVGVLRKTVDTGSSTDGQKYLANIVIAGILKLKQVSSANGGTSGITVAGSLLENASTNSVLGTFKF